MARRVKGARGLVRGRRGMLPPRPMKIYDSFGPNPRALRMFLLEKGLDLPKKDSTCSARRIAARRTPTAIPAGRCPHSRSTTAA